MSHPSDKRFQNTSFCDIFAADGTGVAGDSSPDSTSGNEFVDENESFRSSPVLEPQNHSPLFKTPINRCIWKRKLSSSSDIALECTKDDVIHCPFSSTPVPSCSRLEKESPGLNLIFATEETFGTISSLVDKKDVSWTSSMATPVRDAQSTSFNTEEKKLLMPSENDSEHSSAPLCSANRVLFSEEADNNAWCEILNLTPKDSDQKTSRTSPVLGGKSDGSYWYWADSQKLVCRTPRRRSSLRRGEKSQLKLPSRRSQFSECKKSENFLFDTNFSQESIFKSSNDRDEELGAHNGERLEKGKANDIHVLESPLMIRNNTENNLSKKHTPSVTQQFSHDLSASMLEEVCLATEIMSSVKNCDDIQDVFQNDSFSEVKECSKIIKNYESCKVDESYIQESNFRDMASITSQAKRTVHILGKDVQTRDSVSEEKESKENVNVNDPSSPVVSLQKYRITNRCNSVLYSKSSSHTLNESVDGSALYEKIMKAALILEEGEKVRSNLKTNTKEVQGPESLPEEFVAFSVLKTVKETENTSREKNVSITLAKVVEDRVDEHNERENLYIHSEQFKDSKCPPLCSPELPEVSSVCDKMSTRGIPIAVTNNVFQVNTRKSLREGSRESVCIKSNDYVLKNENGSEQSCGTMKTEGQKSMLHMKESKRYPNLKSEETEDLDLLMKLLDNGMISCTENNLIIEREKVENIRDNMIENSSKMQEESELLLSQDVFEDCGALGSLANNHTHFVTPGVQEVVHKDFSKNLHSSQYWPCFSGELPDEMFENRENDKKYQDSEKQVTVENKEDMSPPINNVSNEKERVPMHEVEKNNTLASVDFCESVHTCFKDNTVKRAQEFSAENAMSNIYVEENLNMKNAKEVECDIDSMNQELLEDAFPQISRELREPFSINHELHSPIDQSTNHEKPKSRETKMKYEDIKPELMGFSTARGKRISVSEEAMKNAYKLLEECDDDVKNIVPENILEKSLASCVKFENQVIVKAINKLTVDPEKALRPTQKLLRSCDDSTSKKAFNVERCSSLVDGKSQSLEVTTEELCEFKKPLPGIAIISKESSIKTKKRLKVCKATSQCTKIQEVPAKEENVLAQESFAKANGMNIGLSDLMCQGFTTGQGKKISVSKEAVERAQKMFEECCENNRSSDSQDFTSIKGKKHEDSESSEQDTTVEGNSVASVHGFEGFSAANGKNITVPKESLRKMQTIFEESCECTDVEDLLLISNNVGNSDNFHTKSAPQKMSLLSYDNSLQCEFKMSSNANAKKEAVSEYTTKRNIDEENSKHLTKKSFVTEDLFTMESEVALLDCSKRPNKMLERCDMKPEFSFSTASGKKVNISEESLKKGQELFEECKEPTESLEFLTTSDNVPKIDNHQNSPIHQQPQNHAPSHVELERNPDEKSASLKKKTMCNSERKLRDHEEVSFELKAFQNISSAHNKFLGEDHSLNRQSTKLLGKCTLKYSTSGNMKSVAEESLKKAQSLFEDVEEHTGFRNCFPTYNNTSGLNNREIKADGTSGKAILQPEFKGFATAGGENVGFSKESLEKAKTLFEECDVHTEIQELLPTNNALRMNNSKVKNEVYGYSAAKEKISIINTSPKKALEPKNHKVYNEIEDSNLARNVKTESYIHQIKSNVLLVNDSSVHPELKRFSTAGGKSISISEQSMKKAQKIFEECEQLPEGMEIVHDNNELGPNIPQKKSCVSLQERDTTPQPTLRVFSSASGKNATVFEEAVEEAQKLLSEENISKEPSAVPDVPNQKRAASFPPHIRSKKSLGGRTTHKRQEVHRLSLTSGKAVAISKESLEKVCRDCEGTPDPMKPTVCSVSNRISMKRPFESPEDSAMSLEFIASCSSNVKKVPHSEERQAKARKLLDERVTIILNKSADLQKNTPLGKKEYSASEKSLKDLHEFLPAHTFQGFSTASGKKVNMSEESMKKAQKIFQEFEESATSNNLPYPSEIPVSVKGFVSAKGKKISISKESLKKAEKMFQECEEGASLLNLPDQSEIFVGVKGFASAKGKKIPVSAESLKKAQKMFQECDEDATSFKISQTPEVPVDVDNGTAMKLLKTRPELKDSTDLAFKGFSTASGKKVNISEESLKKAQKLFEESDESTLLNLPETSEFPFGIGNGSTVKPKKAPCEFTGPNSTDQGFKGFSTASGKKVNISEESLKKAHKLFEESDESTLLNLPETSEIPFGISNGSTVKPKKTPCEFTGPNSTDQGFKGFSTASGKKVNISEESLKKAQKLFEESDESTLLNLPETSEFPFGIGNGSTVKPKKAPCEFTGPNSTDQGFKGFSTASGKKVNISEESLKKAHKLFEESDESTLLNLPETSEIPFGIGNGSTVKPKKTPCEFTGPNSTDQGFKGFSTASGKKVNISEESLKKAQKLFEESDESTLLNLPETSEIPFGIGNGSTVKPKKTPCEFTGPNSTDQGFKGFSTASGKKVNISEESLKKAQKLFEESDESTLLNLPETSEFPFGIGNGSTVKPKKTPCEFTGPNSTDQGFKGFSTASGKKVNISEESLKKAQKLFEESDESTLLNLPETSEIPFGIGNGSTVKPKKTPCEFTGPNSTDKGFKGFSTASGKKVNFSEESLKKAQKLFEESDESTLLNLPETSEIPFGIGNGSTVKPKKTPCEFTGPNSTDQGFKGFSTASGKKVNISEESLKKAQKLFEESDESTLLNLPETSEIPFGIGNGSTVKPKKTPCEFTGPNSTDQGFKGFSTASGKKVNISEESLKKAQKLFEESDESTLLNLPETSEIPFGIGNGSTVKPKKTPCEFTGPNSTDQGFKGFSTASGKKVNISDELLKKAQKLFEEFDESTLLNLPDTSEIPFGIGNGSTVKPKKTPCEFTGPNSTDQAFKGFSTASGKKVNISEESLKKAQKLFEESDESTPLNLPEISEIPFGISNGSTVKPKKTPCEFTGPNSTDQAFKGFSTASGKKVNVSEEALKKVQNLFEECNGASPFNLIESSEIVSDGHNMSVTTPSKSMGHNSTDLAFKEFSTASVKNAHVSDDKLKKVPKMFEECVDRAQFENSFANSDRATIVANKSQEVKTPNTFSRVPIFGGFLTASGKNVTVTEEALNKAQKLLEECADTTPSFELSECSSDRKIRTASTKTLPTNKNSQLQEESSFTASKKTIITSDHNVSTKRESAKEADSYVETPVRSRVERAVCSKRTFDSSQPAKKFRKDDSFSGTAGEQPSFAEQSDPAKPRASDEESALAQREAAPSGRADGAPTASSADEPAPPRRRPESCLRHEKQLLDASDADIDDICRDFLDNSFCARLSGVAAAAAAAAGAGGGVSRKLSFAGAADGPRLSAPPDDELSQEVRECMSALLADEAGAVAGAGGRGGGRAPAWARSLLSCPDMVHDRSPAPAPLLSAADPDDALHPDGPASPVLGRTDRFARRPRRALRRRMRKTALALDDSGSVCSSPADSLSCTPQPSPSPAHAATTPLATASAGAAPKAPASSFKVPYKTLTTPTGAPASASYSPASAPPASKRPAGSSPCYGTPFLRRPGGARARPPPARPPPPPPPPPPAEAVGSARARAAAAQAAAVAEARKAGAQGAAAAAGGGARPCQGSLLLRKRTERAARLTWRAAARGRHPARLPLRTLLRYGMKECVINVTSENSPCFKFLAWEFYSPKLSAENVDGIPVGDGAMLILDAESKAGVVEVARAFLASPGVQPSLVPEGWVENHFRWLVWKLATTERSFPQLFAGRCLTPNVLLLQLKYRYDRELDCCERPALRRILEKDDAPGKRLILCVAAVLPVHAGTQNKNESDSPATVASVDERFSSDCELLLTDGWYSVTGAVDREMCRLVHSGQVAVGTKLITHGAELVNCDEGCSPLEAPSAVRLKLHTNSTRRACWDARLGFQNCTGPFPVQLNSVLPNGGLVGCVRVLISRVYPVMYLEKLSNGKSVARTERAEMRVAAHFEQQRQLKLEQLYSQERAKFSQERRGKRRVSIRELAQITSGHELCELLDSDPDPSSLQSLLTEEQRNAVREFQQGYRDQLTRELQSRIQQQLGEEKSTSRNVVCVLKIRCLDVKTRDSSKTALLSVWRPSEEAVNLLKEGCMVKLFSVTAHGNRMGSLQLSTGRQTRYCPVPLPRLVPYFQRRVSSFDEILSPNFQPPFNEMDTVGLIVHVGSGPQSSHFETMYLADADMRIIGVSFWGGMKEFGWEDLLRPNSFVAASNLQWRQNSITQRVICTYASEFSTFTKSPKQILLKEALDDLKYNIQMDLKQFSSACKELIFSHINGKLTGETSSYQKEKQVTPLSARSHSALSEVPEEDGKETPVRKKLRKLEQYADPPPISPLFLPSPGLSLKKQFHIPSKNPPCASSNILCKPVVESVENYESPPLSLDEPG